MQQVKMLIYKNQLTDLAYRQSAQEDQCIFSEKTNWFWFISPGIPLHSEVGWTLFPSEQIQVWRLCQVYPVAKSI